MFFYAFPRRTVGTRKRGMSNDRVALFADLQFIKTGGMPYSKFDVERSMFDVDPILLLSSHLKKSRITLFERIRPTQKITMLNVLRRVLSFGLPPSAFHLLFHNPASDFGKRAIESVTRLPMYRY